MTDAQMETLEKLLNQAKDEGRKEERDRANRLASLLAEAEKYLREGKERWAPGTTNSRVDDLLKAIPEALRPELATPTDQGGAG
jgi:hypothetical protein